MASEMVFVLSCPPDAATRLDIEDFAVSVCDEARLEGLGMLDGCRSKGPSVCRMAGCNCYENLSRHS